MGRWRLGVRVQAHDRRCVGWGSVGSETWAREGLQRWCSAGSALARTGCGWKARDGTTSRCGRELARSGEDGQRRARRLEGGGHSGPAERCLAPCTDKSVGGSWTGVGGFVVDEGFFYCWVLVQSQPCRSHAQTRKGEQKSR